MVTRAAKPRRRNRPSGRSPSPISVAGLPPSCLMPAGPVRHTGQLPACYANDFRAGASLLTAGTSHRTDTIPKISIFINVTASNWHDLEKTQCLPMSPPRTGRTSETQCLPMSPLRTGTISKNSMFTNVTAPDWPDPGNSMFTNVTAPDWPDPGNSMFTNVTAPTGPVHLQLNPYQCFASPKLRRHPRLASPNLALSFRSFAATL